MSRSLTWADRRFALLGEDAGLGGLKWTTGSPAGWDEARPCAEENIETLLLFHLADITSRPLTVRRRGWVMEPGQDLVATDELGRIHLFELKKGNFTARDCDQLEQYLLRQVFADRQDFLTGADEDFWKQMSPLRTARAIAAATAATRGDTVGFAHAVRWLTLDELRTWFGDGTPTQYRYAKLGATERVRLQIAALLSQASARGALAATQDDLKRVLELGGTWSERLSQTPPESAATATAPVVLWLVGRRIAAGAEERIRRWRAAGVDARALGVELRRGLNGWMIAVRTENAQPRDAFEDSLTELLRRRPGLPSLAIQLYDTVTPSSSHTKGGNVLEDPVATLDDVTRIRADELLGSARSGMGGK